MIRYNVFCSVSELLMQAHKNVTKTEQKNINISVDKA